MKKVTTLTGKIAAIAVFIATLLAVQPTRAEELRAEIQSVLNAGDTANGITMIKDEIKVDPGFHYNYYILGRIYYNQMQYEKAKKQFEIALDKKKRHYESIYYLALTNLKLGNVKEAEKEMENGLKKSGKELKAWFENGMGLIQMAEKNYAEADRSFRRALAEDPENPEYHINLGDANFYQGIPALAILEYQKALEVDTASLEVYYHWAEACLDMKDYTCAIEKLKIVLEKDSTHAPAWMRAGSIYYKAARSAQTRSDQIERFKEAIGSYRKYIELSKAQPDSSNVRAFFELAMCYYSLNGFEEAVENFQKVLNIPYEPRDIYFYYGKSLWGIKEYDKSAEMLQKHLKWVETQDSDYKSTASTEEVYRLIGDAYFYRKPRQFLTALTWYRKSLEINPNQKRLLYNIAVAYHTNKSYAQAIEYYEKRIALGIDSSESNIYKNAGFCALNLANSETGEEDAGLGIEDELGMNGDATTEDLGDDTGLDTTVNYYQLAIDYLTKYTEFNSKDNKVVTLIANTYLYQLSDCTNGVNWFQKVLALEPGNCDAKKAIGFAYFGGLCTKNYSKALSYLKDAYSCQTDNCADTELPMWIAQCYHLQGADKIAAKKSAAEEFKNAYEWYGKVLKCDPNNAAAKKARDELQFEF